MDFLVVPNQTCNLNVPGFPAVILEIQVKILKHSKNQLKVCGFVDIGDIFFNLKIILIFSLYQEKYLKFNQSECRMSNPEQPIRSREV